MSPPTLRGTLRTAEDFVPDATSGSTTSIDAAASPDAVWQALEGLRVDELRATRLLMGIRSLPAILLRRGSLEGSTSGQSRTLIDAMTSSRFVALHREPGRILTLGIVGQFWRLDGGRDAEVRDRDGFVSFDRPGFVKSAIDFVIESHSSGARLETRTRNRATDDGTARRFNAYWRVIGPGSKLIRLDMLRAVRGRAEHGLPVT